MANLIFYLMAALAVVAALGVVAARNPIMSILALLGSFFALAAIYLVSGFQTLAALQILVYAGAILVLFLFVIMLLNLANETKLERIDLAMFHGRKAVWTFLIAGALLGISAFAALAIVPAAGDAPALPERGIDELQPLADAMFSRYLLPFELVSVLLLATAVAVLVLAKRNRGPLNLDQGGEST
ncbi:MAG: NADH-quinone oxidoreductase subunit J [Planctomycetes bacterium]|nr:NADH-quinone oxidoreductase subunit J [Planctomycetota bacterium]